MERAFIACIVIALMFSASSIAFGGGEDCSTLKVNGKITNPTSTDAKDGKITINIKGGSAPYEYHWLGTNIFHVKTKDLEGVGEGTFQLLVVDENQCQVLTPFTVGSSN